MIVRYQLSFPIPSGILDPYSISVEADMNSSNPEETVHLNVAGAIATITLARPHLRNALDRKTMKSLIQVCLLYTSPSPRDRQKSRMPSSA